ncbi:conserved hypothetical protein [Vibrio chagasii]|nr:conserved hypothetical protein [Vibrio chagasii]
MSINTATNTEENTATIYEVLDKANQFTGFGVRLNGHAADEFGIDTDESFGNSEEAHDFAEQCKIEAGAVIVWACTKPWWA